MPNNTRIHDDATWAANPALAPSDWAGLESRTFHSWNGDRGGSYSASGAHVIAGAGLQVSGPTRLKIGGRIEGPSSAFVIKTGTWPLLGATHTGRTRKIVQPVHAFKSPNPYLWARHPTLAGIGSVALACRLTYTRLIDRAEMYIPLRVVDGARLTSVEVRMRVMTARKEAPLEMPRIRVLRVPNDIGSAFPVSLVDSTDGFYSPASATPTAWYASGAPQSIVVPCTVNNAIDVSAYSYVVHIVEELGANSTEAPFDGFRLIERKPDAFIRYPTVPTIVDDQKHGADGRVYGIVWGDDVDVPADPLVPADFGGDDARVRILILDSDAVIDSGELTNDSANVGLWNIFLSGVHYWRRAADLDAPEDFTPNWIVRCLAGWRDSNSTWQCQYPSTIHKPILDPRYMESVADPSALPAPVPEDLTRIRITPPVVRGNLYHSLTPTFELTDLRFQ